MKEHPDGMSYHKLLDETNGLMNLMFRLDRNHIIYVYKYYVVHMQHELRSAASFVSQNPFIGA